MAIHDTRLKLVALSKFPTRAKKGAFKGASRDAKKEYGKKAKDVFGMPEKWSKEDLDDMKDFLDEVPSKYLKKVPTDVVRDKYHLELELAPCIELTAHNNRKTNNNTMKTAMTSGRIKTHLFVFI